MARVELTASAVEDLERLILTHSLPIDTKQRFANALLGLRQFPMLGPALPGDWSGLRFVLGPWRWMLCVYAYNEYTDTVTIVTVQDGRSSRSATNAGL
ncbi:MAG: type II toxin-antitoxin system RelE/ParE family toxin [Trueperaceae bacterium]|nr:type II toxin-antitoxin system RelE/ParE family toxin [Trueperaceae bacterium]